jgi:hypothetical protein
MLKKITITLGIFFILLSLVTIVPNNLVGKNAIFATDFLRNLMHLFIGGLLLFLAIWHTESLLMAYRVLGYIFISLAVVGSWSTGYDIGKLFGLMIVNGVGNIFNLIVGVYCIIIGTSEMRNHRIGHKHA